MNGTDDSGDDNGNGNFLSLFEISPAELDIVLNHINMQGDKRTYSMGLGW